MTIQSFIDRKRAAGAREHEGNKTDWAGWTQEQFLAAIAGELLDAAAYAQRAMEVAFECGNKDLFNDANDTLLILFEALCNFKDEVLEAACQEAEAVEADSGIAFACGHERIKEAIANMNITLNAADYADMVDALELWVAMNLKASIHHVITTMGYKQEASNG